MSDKLVSILIPTRNRFDSLLEAVGSIVDKTKDLKRVEIVMRFDEDDENSLSRLEELPTDKIDINIIIGKRYGYEKLHKYVNEMCEETKGEFILWFNDDCIIETSGWDDVVEPYRGQIVCFYPNNKDTGSGNIFPMISRKIYEITGHFSMAQQVDTWQHVVGKRADVVVRIEDVVFIHNREQDYVSDDNRSKVLRETRRVWRASKNSRLRDSQKIKSYIIKNCPNNLEGKAQKARPGTRIFDNESKRRNKQKQRKRPNAKSYSKAKAAARKKAAANEPKRQHIKKRTRIENRRKMLEEKKRMEVAEAKKKRKQMKENKIREAKKAKAAELEKLEKAKRAAKLKKAKKAAKIKEAEEAKLKRDRKSTKMKRAEATKLRKAKKAERVRKAKKAKAARKKDGK
jgi:glycosyltransferase involved in cell wall biosynthesis